MIKGVTTYSKICEEFGHITDVMEVSPHDGWLYLNNDWLYASYHSLLVEIEEYEKGYGKRLGDIKRKRLNMTKSICKMWLEKLKKPVCIK